MNEDDFLEKVIGFLLVRYLTISNASLLLLGLLRSFDCQGPFLLIDWWDMCAVQEGAKAYRRIVDRRYVPYQLLLCLRSVPAIYRFPRLVHERATGQLLALQQDPLLRRCYWWSASIGTYVDWGPNVACLIHIFVWQIQGRLMLHFRGHSCWCRVYEVLWSSPCI